MIGLCMYIYIYFQGGAYYRKDKIGGSSIYSRTNVRGRGYRKDFFV